MGVAENTNSGQQQGKSTKRQNTQTAFLKSSSRQESSTNHFYHGFHLSACPKQAQSSGRENISDNFQVFTQICLYFKWPLNLSVVPLHHAAKECNTASTCLVPCRKAPTSIFHREGANGNSTECHCELQSICSMQCSRQPSLQSFSMRGCSSGLILKESGPSHPCCSFNDVNELQQG